MQRNPDPGRLRQLLHAACAPTIELLAEMTWRGWQERDLLEVHPRTRAAGSGCRC